MGTFACTKCNVLENTALGTWHTCHRNMKNFGLPDNMPLCSQCTPSHYLSGTPVTKGGKWHNRFPRRKRKDHPNILILNPSGKKE